MMEAAVRYLVWNEGEQPRLLLLRDGDSPGEMVMVRSFDVATTPKVSVRHVPETSAPPLVPMASAEEVHGMLTAAGENRPTLPVSLTLPTLADEIMAKLPELVPAWPKGVSIKLMAELLAAEPQQVLKAFRDLHEEGRAVLYKQRAKTGFRLLPAGGTPPAIDLSESQERLFRLLSAVASKDGIVRRRSYCYFGKDLGISVQSVKQGIALLVEKGVIEILTPNAGRKPATYRVKEAASKAEIG